MLQLITGWGEALDKEKVWQEYPRPSLVRDSYLNLNGIWGYRITKEKGASGSASPDQIPKEEDLDGEIVVPFSPETYLSGVGRIVGPEDILWYRKAFCLPEGFKKSRVLLHFGAVDQECEVYVNGIHLGGHKGGYLPFSFDVTDALMDGENILSLSVVDKTEKLPHARGKQKLHKKGKFGSLFYTPQSGIWQTVWMESVEEVYIKWLKIDPLFDEGAVRFKIGAEGRPRGAAKVRILDEGRLVAEAEGMPGKSFTVKLAPFRPWSPKDPHLYDVEVCLDQDKVTSYLGMRKVSTGMDEKGIRRFFLNNEPYFFNGLLDQGYWPDGLMTPPSDEALKYDIVKLKEMGYNTIRKHVKVEPERFYYHCDRLGMIVWQDMPNGGGEYDMVFVTYLPNASDWFARNVSDRHHRAFKRQDKEGRRQYYHDLTGMVRHLYDHPCIAAWVPFNEGWGQFDAPKATKRLRRMDQSRLINEACGWFDQKGGDMYSIHNYNRKLVTEPQKDRVVALTEYGGYTYPVEGHKACEKKFGYQHYNSKEELTANYRRLWEEEIYPNLERGLSAAIYTQTSDIEEEINGVMTYDRKVDKLLLEEVQALNRKLYARFSEVVRASDAE